MRGNERAAASLGISVFGAKIFAFGFSSGIAAVGGILLGFRNYQMQLQEFDAFNSILVLSYALIGGVGYTNEYPVGRLWRDAKLYEIGAGTSEIRRMLIGRELYAESM